MARTSLYNDNANRDFPFLKGTSIGPLSSIVGCGFMLGPNTGFAADEHQVLLTRIARRDDRFYFYFTSDAPALVGKELVFVRNVTDPPYVIEHVEHLPPVDSLSESLSQSESESVADLEPIDSPEARCDYADAFMGFLITGPLEELADALADNEDLTGDAIVEPALLQSLVNTYGRSINLANADRTRYQPPPSCGDAELGEALYVQATCLRGKIVFVPGYNALILQNDFDNSLTFSAAVGAGAGEPCAQVPIYPGETPPENSLYYEGGPSCSEVVRRFGGAAGPLVQVSGGNGVNVSFQPSRNTVVVNIDLHSLASCGDSLFEASVLAAECEHELGSATPVALRAPMPRVSGFAAVLQPGTFHITAAGALIAPAATASGAGIVATHVFVSGALAAPTPTVDGTTLLSNTAYGPLMPPMPTVSGVADIVANNLASGALTAPKPTVAGTGVVAVPSDSGFGGSSGLAVVYSSVANMWVLAGADGNGAYSPSGINWTHLVPGSSTGLKFGTSPIWGLRFYNGLFYAFGSGNSTSTDGISWTARLTWPSAMRVLMYDGVSRLVGGGGLGFNSTIFYSDDFGNSWSTITSDYTHGILFGPESTLSGVYAQGKYVLGGTGGYASYSTNGTTWTSLLSAVGGSTGIKFGNTADNNEGDVQRIIYAGGKFVAVGGRDVPGATKGGFCSYSSDGVNWTALTRGVGVGIKFGTDSTARGVAYGNGRYVVVGDGGKASYSSDAISWTSLPAGETTGIKFGTRVARDIYYGNGAFVAVGDRAASWSVDGINWTRLYAS